MQYAIRSTQYAIPLHDSVLMQAGLAVQELESDDVRATQLTDGVVELLEALQSGLRQAITDWLGDLFYTHSEGEKHANAEAARCLG